MANHSPARLRKTHSLTTNPPMTRARNAPLPGFRSMGTPWPYSATNNVPRSCWR